MKRTRRQRESSWNIRIASGEASLVFENAYGALPAAKFLNFGRIVGYRHVELNADFPQPYVASVVSATLDANDLTRRHPRRLVLRQQIHAELYALLELELRARIKESPARASVVNQR